MQTMNKTQEIIQTVMIVTDVNLGKGIGQVLSVRLA